MRSFKTVCAVLIAASLTLVQVPVAAKQPAATPNLVDAAIEVNSAGPYAGAFSTIIALVAADESLYEALTSKGQYTVFAPTNAAFDALFATAQERCVTLEPDLVSSVLKYHVVKGRRDSTDVLASDRLRTLLSAFWFQSGGIITDGAGETASVIAVDIPASNGILHAIDAVLLPFPLLDQCGQ